MDNIDTLMAHGLFDAKVPRYTSYPPANHFQADVGRRSQSTWLSQVEDGEDVSIYVHIPFCKRLCWFCACRTQGTKTLRPVEAYLEVLKTEIAAVRSRLPKSIHMARLHLGGGTPTILSAKLMSNLLIAIFNAFEISEDFEFSVEIDPTEASDAVLQTLIDFGMNRASIGVQDFANEVQAAIGRPQTPAQTQRVLNFVRSRNVQAVNLDLLYGLPFQTDESFQQTLDRVVDMSPDRLAIYGYAHVPWMSKRQVLIKSETLPDTKHRFQLAQLAHSVFTNTGYAAVGIDHFAKPSDSLFTAAKNGRLKRNFQGYTDDQCSTLIGFGASAISRFEGGYIQNAVATSAYQDRVLETGFAAHKGYVMRESDHLIAAMIEELMCRFRYPTKDLQRQFPRNTEQIRNTAIALIKRYTDVFHLDANGLIMRPEGYPLARIIAEYIDTFSSDATAHAAAI